MDSRIAAAIHLELEPVALIWADEKPEGAMEFALGKWGCVMFLLAAAAKGKTAVASRETFGCWGGGVGLGFGDHYQNFPGGEECFCRFLSSGNAGSEPGQTIGQQMAASGATAMADEFLQGEHNENVAIPFAAGCQAIGICTYRESEKENPRAVVGLVDLSARKNVRRQLGKDVMSFSVTAEMFQRMKGNVDGSFLERETWKSLLK